MIDALPGDIFASGQILNNTYEIEGVLGRGGTGEAYRARNLISGRVVAIKALNKMFSGNDAYIDLMKREEQMRDIVHDSVVRYTECSRSDQGHVFLVMDFIDGPSLNDEMGARRLGARELLVIAHRVAEGLVAAHARGIVHRDLSPDNIVLRNGDPERATIIDFGIAKDTAAGARTIVGNEFAGKYEYAAPEQLEGRAETRSDLYSLGALLLAAFRGTAPFAGSTPGEIVRRKQTPLDTQGVPEPLKGMVERLTAARAEDRPASAREVAAEIEALLRPAGPARTADGRDHARGGRRLWPVLLAGGLAVAGAGAWTTGLLDPLIGRSLPVATPYLFAARAAAGDAPATLAGNAPSAEAAAQLVAAFNRASGGAAPDGALSLAQGMPSETWPAGVAAALEAVEGLEDWSVTVSDRTATVGGIAADRAAGAAARQRLSDWAERFGFDLSANVAAGPVRLPVADLTAALAGIADCGALTPDLPADAAYPLGATIRVTGDVAQAATAARVAAELDARIGDRRLVVETTTLNDQLCAVRKVLPDVPTGDLSIWMGDGATGAANLTGVFHAGQNPVVEVQAPASLTDGSLWVALIDNTGKVFNVLPNINAEEHDLIDIGVMDNGVRRVRVLHALAALQTDSKLLAFKVTEGDFGKSEIVAILSRRPLFDVRRPRDESVASFAEALAEIQRRDPGNIIALASRLLDSRP